jgi:ankyrin repeat protein
MAGLIAFFGSSYNSAKVYSQVSSEKSRRTEDTEQKVENNRKNKSSRIKRFKNYISKVLFDSLAEYGPPYEFDEYYSGALLFQCSRPIEKSLEVHRLLNAKIDPNDVDPAELNYTPMHWCAKHCYLKSMRMLVMAKAHINVTNEFGQSPLSLCIMMMQPLNKKGVQIEMVEYLLDLGANIEVRDKSGNRPLDYAVLNQNVVLINMCLDYGALVRRDNKFFSVQTGNLLDQVDDPDCLERMEAILYTEMTGEREKEEEENLRQELEEKNAADREARIQKAEKRMKKLADRTKGIEQQELDELARVKKKKLDDQFKLAKAAKAIAEHGM